MHKNVFMLPVNFIGSYTEDEPGFPRQNNLRLQKTGVWRRQGSKFADLIKKSSAF